jgi:hypothetical protein
MTLSSARARGQQRHQSPHRSCKRPRNPTLNPPKYTYGSHPINWGLALVRVGELVYIYGAGVVWARRGGAGRVIVSYNVNTSAVSVGCRSLAEHDGSIYRPRFLNVPLGKFDNTAASTSPPADQVPALAPLANDNNWYDSWAPPQSTNKGCRPLNQPTTLAGTQLGLGEAWCAGLGSRDLTPARVGQEDRQPGVTVGFQTQVPALGIATALVHRT